MNNYDSWLAEYKDWLVHSNTNTDFPQALRTVHNVCYPNNKLTATDIKSLDGTKYYGSGDIAPDNSFWYDALINNSSQVSQDIPPLDESKFMDSDSLTSTYGNVINKYEIKSENIGTDEFLEKMNKLTFNVRAQRVEELLEELIEKIDGGDKPSSPKPSTPTNTNLFTNNSIPEQVTRLSRG